jgi:hypothetical protein
MRRFGGLIASVVLVFASACIYSFAGGGLPPHIRTIAIATFDNQTASPDLPKEIYDEMRRELQRRLGVRDAPRDRADAIVTGVIQTYVPDMPVSFSADPRQSLTAQRRLQLTVQIEIVDVASGKVLFQNKALREEADYAERAEQEGRKLAITKMVQKIVEGVQSNW